MGLVIGYWVFDMGYLLLGGGWCVKMEPMEVSQKKSLDRRIHYDIHGRPYRFKAAKPGPKPLPELRRKIVPVRMSAFEKDLALKNAEKRGMSLSEYIRELVYEDSVYTESS